MGFAQASGDSSGNGSIEEYDTSEAQEALAPSRLPIRVKLFDLFTLKFCFNITLLKGGVWIWLVAFIFGNFQRLPWEQCAPIHENDSTGPDKKSGIFDNNQQPDLGKSIIQDWKYIYDTSWEHSFTLHQFLSQEMLEPRVYVAGGN